MNKQPDWHDRGLREREAHDQRDVLAESHRLKRLFAHVTNSPTMRRLEADFQGELANLAGRRVLDLGCGEGEQSVDLVRRGALVTGVDISERHVASAHARCVAAGFAAGHYTFRVADAHALQFGDRSFDLVVGRGILHHLDLARALAEIARVLVPGGVALFQEPLAANPLLRLFRVLTPRARTVDERPLSAGDLESIGTQWSVSNRYYGLLGAPGAVLTSVFARPFPDNALLRRADAWEQWLNRSPALRPYNQYVLMRLTRR
jgi:SAM-dependent methyltransferase